MPDSASAMNVGMGMPLVVIVTVGMTMIVLMVMRMVVPGSGHHRLENLESLLERDVVTLEHLLDRQVIFHQQAGFRELGGEVQVANLPSPMGRLLLIGVRHAKHCLGSLLKRISLVSVDEETVTV